MNNILKTIIFCAGAVSFSACSDFLDQQSPSEMTPDLVFQSTVYTKQAVNKIYASLTRDHMYGARLPLNFSTNSDIELVDATDESNITNIANERGNCNYNMSKNWNRLPQTWQYMYQAIESCNECIEGITNAGMKAEVLPSLGEALTLRAMLFYDLIKNFGDVPMKMETTRPDGSNIYLPKTQRDVIYDKLIADLWQAAEYLPWQGQSAGYTSERVTKGFALGMIGRIALAASGYSIREGNIEGYEKAKVSDATYPTLRPGAQKRQELLTTAVEALDMIISSGRHNLNASFEKQWEMTNQLILDQTTQENLFEVAHGLGYTGEIGYTVGVRMAATTTQWGFSNSSGKVKLTAPFFYSYDKDDLRRDITCAPYEYRATDNRLIQTMQGNAPWAMYVGKWDFRKMSDTWAAKNKTVTAKTGYGINWIIMRYSDVLLMYAEALNELSGPNAVGKSGVSPAQALLQVRQRAFDDASVAAAYVSKVSGSYESMFNAIVDERAWELAGEGIRKYDLIRWGLLSDKIEQMRTDYNKVIATAPENLYFRHHADTLSDGSIVKNSDIIYSSVCWYEEPNLTDEQIKAEAWTSVSFFGKDLSEGEAAKNVLIGKMISNGLNNNDRGVINSHLFPIGESIISTSMGYLENSYGF